jgi:Multiubiquitin
MTILINGKEFDFSGAEITIEQVLFLHSKGKNNFEVKYTRTKKGVMQQGDRLMVTEGLSFTVTKKTGNG